MSKVRTQNYVCEPCNRNSFSIEICPCTQNNCKATKAGMVKADTKIVQTMRRKRAQLLTKVNRLGLTTWQLAGGEVVWFDNRKNSPTQGKVLTKAPGDTGVKVLDITLSRVDKL